MKFVSFGSGSEGNVLLILVVVGDQCFFLGIMVMLDCGFILCEVEKCMLCLGLDFFDVLGIVVMYEYLDYVSGVFKFVWCYCILVWFSYGIWQVVVEQVNDVDVCFCVDGQKFVIGDFEFFFYIVLYDVCELVQYVVSDGDCCLGVLIDVGQLIVYLV